MPPTLSRGTINSYFNDFSIATFLQNNLKLLNGVVLDIGSGRMRYKNTILSAPHVTTYVGLDLQTGKFAYSNKADVYWDGVTMPFENNSIDNAVLFEVLEHCENPTMTTREAYRVLKPEGNLLFSTPFVYQLHGFPHDYQRLTPSGIRKIMLDAGFSDVQIFPSGSWDASLGQMISIWISHRPLPAHIRKVLAVLFVPIFKLLLVLDKKQTQNTFSDNDIMPGILGIAQK